MAKITKKGKIDLVKMNFPETFHEDTAEEEAEYAIRQMAQIMQPDSDMEWQTGHGPRQL
jgi:hypothetical protein